MRWHGAPTEAPLAPASRSRPLVAAPRQRVLVGMMQTSAQHETYPILPVYQAITGQHIDAREGRSIPARCPIHDDRHASLSLDTIGQRWYCHACGVGGDAVELAARSLDFGSITNRYREAFRFVRDVLHIDTPPEYRSATSYGTPQRHAPSVRLNRAPKKAAAEPFRLLKTIRYPFTDAEGRPLYEEVRREGVNPETGEPRKQIVLQRIIPDGTTWMKGAEQWILVDADGAIVPCGPTNDSPIVLPLRTRDGREVYPHKMRRINHVTGLPRVLYRLPDVLAAATRGDVLGLVEGPKKADTTATALEIIITSLAGGARAHFTAEHAACFRGAQHVLVFADADGPGREAARAHTSAIVAAGTPASIIDVYPNRQDGLDIADWLAQHPSHSPETLRRLLRPFSTRFTL